jgi:hypothetical protein
MMEKGVYLHPDDYERIALSSVYSENDIEVTLAVFEEGFRELHERHSLRITKYNKRKGLEHAGALSKSR